MTEARTTVRVLHVAQPTDAGVAVYVADAAADQRARGWDVTVACPDGGHLAGDLADRGVERFTWQATRSPGPATADEIRRLRRIIGLVRPDVLHLHSSKAGLAGRLAVRGRIPTMFQPHGWSWLAVDGPMATATLAWERWASRWTDVFVCVGAAEARKGGRAGLSGRYAMVRNGIDLSRFRPADHETRALARAAAGIAPDVPLAVCVGRVTRQKGQDVLVDAWRTVHRHLPAAELALVGNGDLVPRLRTEAPSGVRFVPGVRDVRPWYAAADVVVLPSRWEGLSLVAVEAMASGRPVVASDIAGLSEVVCREAGALVPPENPAALAEQIEDRLGDPARTERESLAAAGQALDFDLGHTLDELAEITAEIADREPVV